MNKLEKGLLLGLALLLGGLAYSTLSLQGELKALVQAYSSYGGVTNYTELAPGDASLQWHKLEITSFSTSTAFKRNDDGFSRIVDYSELTLNGTSSASTYWFFLATSTQPMTHRGLVGGAINDPFQAGTSSLPLYASSTIPQNLLSNYRVATGTDFFNNGISIRGTTTPFQWRAGEYLGLVVLAGDTYECATCQPATSSLRGFSTVTLLLGTHATSTNNDDTVRRR